MIITRAQLQVLEDHAENAFVRGMMRHLREEHGDVTVSRILPTWQRLRDDRGAIALGELTDAELEPCVRVALARARSHGLSSSYALTAFIALMFVIAPNFDEHPLVRRVLADARWTPDERFDRVLELASAPNWEGARARYQAGAWAQVP